jgi:hypothetical protein
MIMAAPKRAAIVIAPSPHSPSKTGVNAVLAGEGAFRTAAFLLKQ